MMKKVNIEIKKNSIEMIIDNVVEKYPIFLFDMYASYILSILEETSIHNSNNFQIYIEDYNAERINASNVSDIDIPKELKIIVENIREGLIKDSLNYVIWNDRTYKVNINLKKVIEDIYIDELSEYFDNITDSEVSLYIEEEYGPSFVDTISEIIKLNGNRIILGSTESEKIEVYYEDKLILSSDEIECDEIVVTNIYEPYILFVIKFFSNEVIDDTKNVKMFFPYWDCDDMFKISISKVDKHFLLIGEHIKSGIISKVAI